MSSKIFLKKIFLFISSRMRTARLLTVSQHALPGGVLARGDTCPGVYLPGGVPVRGVPAQVLPPWTDRYLRKLRLLAVKKEKDAISALLL